MLGKGQEPYSHNVIGNDKRDGNESRKKYKDENMVK
jgi:hypothetical protein